jgi:hypothetical protein
MYKHAKNINLGNKIFIKNNLRIRLFKINEINVRNDDKK